MRDAGRRDTCTLIFCQIAAPWTCGRRLLYTRQGKPGKRNCLLSSCFFPFHLVSLCDNHPFLSLILCISDQTNHRFTTKLLWTRRGSSPATTWNNRRRYYPTLSSRFDTSRV